MTRGSAPRTWLPPWPTDLVATPGGRVAVRRAPPSGGTAEPAVFVHGLGGASTNWTDLMGLLRDRVDGLALDLPGFGLSPPPDDGDYTPGGHARSVIGVIEAAGRRPVHLLGNSLGGAVTLRVAAERPDLVRSLTLISPALPDLRPRPFTAGFVPMAAPVLGDRIARALASQDPHRRARQVMALCFADPSAVPPEVLDYAAAELARRRQLTYANDALLASLRGLLLDYLRQGRRSPWRQLAAVSAPTLVIAGGRDRLVHPRVIARVVREIPDSRLLMVPGGGHIEQMEHPDLVERAVRELLADVAAAADPDGAMTPEPMVPARAEPLPSHGIAGRRETVSAGEHSRTFRS